MIQSRIDLLQASMAEAQAAANEETKSSAGDKYETARAMNQLEKDMLGRQLAENQRELAAMMMIDCTGEHQSVKPGSLVLCKGITYFILGGLGKLSLGNETIMVISPHAPLTRSLMGKCAGDRVLFNGREILIQEVR